MQMMRANCSAGCGLFDVVTLPMSAEAACQAMLLRNVCPWCGARDGHTLADPRPLTDDERRVKSAAMARYEAQRAASMQEEPAP